MRSADKCKPISISKFSAKRKLLDKEGKINQSRATREDILELLVPALKDSERGTLRSKALGFNIINRKIRVLWEELQLADKNCPLGKKEVFIWAILELLDTEIETEEILRWAADVDTIEEIINGEGEKTKSIRSYLRDFTGSQERFNSLVSKYL